ncbi:MAG: hypothetical protein ACO3RV_09645, partial [Luteolibacter sp.]
MTWIDEAFGYHFVLRPEYHERLIQAKQRCLMTRDWKIVCTPTAQGGRHFGLFHMRSDPDGLVDLAAEREDVLIPMRRALERWLDDRVESSIAEIFPNGEPGASS